MRMRKKKYMCRYGHVISRDPMLGVVIYNVISTFSFLASESLRSTFPSIPDFCFYLDLDLDIYLSLYRIFPN